MVIMSSRAIDQLVPELKRSKRYEVESGEGLCILTKKYKFLHAYLKAILSQQVRGVEHASEIIHSG